MKNWIIIGLLIVHAVSVKSQDTMQILNVSPGDFQINMDTCVNRIILETRERFQFKKQRIPGAVNVPSMGALDSLTDTLDLDTPLLVYCEIGKRSKTVCVLLQKKGFTIIVNLEKGIRQWKRERFLLDDSALEK